MDKAKELLKVSQELKISAWLLKNTEASEYISHVIKKYHPGKTVGHLAIGGESVAIPIEKYEFSYSQHLKSEPAYIFLIK